MARVNAVSPAIETGHVYLPKGAPWLEDYLKEWSEFPAGKHDDQVDASTQALSKMQYASGVYVAQEPRPEEQYYQVAEVAFLSEACYDPYGMGFSGMLS